MILLKCLFLLVFIKLKLKPLFNSVNGLPLDRLTT